MSTAHRRPERTAAVEPLEGRRLLASVPAGFADSTLVAGLSSPTAMAVAPDGRVFVAEQNGAVRVVKGGRLLATPFATVPTRSDGERGLLGVALDPAFADNGRVYAYYTANVTPGETPHNRVVRWSADGDVAGGGPQGVHDLPPLSSATNHNGGGLAFGPDGDLYVGVGENADRPKAPRLDTPFGKVLRVRPDGSIPADNPFADHTTGVNRAIWAKGLRNPFTLAFSPRTGRLFVNDVGSRGSEEVNAGRAGADYGWPATEGDHADPRYERPVYAYGRDVGRSVAGGAFYDGRDGGAVGGPASFGPDYAGDYFVADFASGLVQRLPVGLNRPAARYDGSVFATGLARPVDLDLAADGALLYLQRGDGSAGAGSIGRIAGTDPGPTATIDATSLVGAVTGGRTVAFGGSGFDAAGVALPASAMAWRVEYVIGGRRSALLSPFAGAGGSFVAPSIVPYFSAGARYRLTLTVTDADGRTRTAVRDLVPSQSASAATFIGPVRPA